MKNTRFGIVLILAVAIGTVVLMNMYKGPSRPQLSFIGMSTGTLVTQLEEMNFSQTFSVNDTKLVGVVAFDQIRDGSTVQATWFSPDERRMPLGRTTIKTETGAKIVRFSLASTEPWEPAPYMLRIDAMTGDGEKMQTATGSLSFFIGMDDDDIQAYLEDFQKWQEAEAEQRAVWDEQLAAEQQILTAVEKRMDWEEGQILERIDLNGDGENEYIMAERTKDLAPSGGGGGVLFSQPVSELTIVDSKAKPLLTLEEGWRTRILTSGETELSRSLPHSDELWMTLLASGTASFTWPAEDKTCTLEMRWVEDQFVISSESC